ncbi:4172_t:CDS:2, partial [Paraglomus occultum]
MSYLTRDQLNEYLKTLSINAPKKLNAQVSPQVDINAQPKRHSLPGLNLREVVKEIVVTDRQLG